MVGLVGDGTIAGILADDRRQLGTLNELTSVIQGDGGNRRNHIAQAVPIFRERHVLSATVPIRPPWCGHGSRDPAPNTESSHQPTYELEHSHSWPPGTARFLTSCVAASSRCQLGQWQLVGTAQSSGRWRSARKGRASRRRLVCPTAEQTGAHH